MPLKQNSIEFFPNSPGRGVSGGNGEDSRNLPVVRVKQEVESQDEASHFGTERLSGSTRCQRY